MSGHAFRPVRSSETGILLVSVPAEPSVPYGFCGCQSSASRCHVAAVRSIAAGAAGERRRRPSGRCRAWWCTCRPSRRGSRARCPTADALSAVVLATERSGRGEAEALRVVAERDDRRRVTAELDAHRDRVAAARVLGDRRDLAAEGVERVRRAGALQRHGRVDRGAGRHARVDARRCRCSGRRTAPRRGSTGCSRSRSRRCCPGRRRRPGSRASSSSCWSPGRSGGR